MPISATRKCRNPIPPWISVPSLTALMGFGIILEGCFAAKMQRHGVVTLKPLKAKVLEELGMEAFIVDELKQTTPTISYDEKYKNLGVELADKDSDPDVEVELEREDKAVDKMDTLVDGDGGEKESKGILTNLTGKGGAGKDGITNGNAKRGFAETNPCKDLAMEVSDHVNFMEKETKKKKQAAVLRSIQALLMNALPFKYAGPLMYSDRDNIGIGILDQGLKNPREQFSTYVKVAAKRERMAIYPTAGCGSLAALPRVEHSSSNAMHGRSFSTSEGESLAAVPRAQPEGVDTEQDGPFSTSEGRYGRARATHGQSLAIHSFLPISTADKMSLVAVPRAEHTSVHAENTGSLVIHSPAGAMSLAVVSREKYSFVDAVHDMPLVAVHLPKHSSVHSKSGGSLAIHPTADNISLASSLRLDHGVADAMYGGSLANCSSVDHIRIDAEYDGSLAIYSTADVENAQIPPITRKLFFEYDKHGTLASLRWTFCCTAGGNGTICGLSAGYQMFLSDVETKIQEKGRKSRIHDTCPAVAQEIIERVTSKKAAKEQSHPACLHLAIIWGCFVFCLKVLFHARDMPSRTRDETNWKPMLLHSRLLALVALFCCSATTVISAEEKVQSTKVFGGVIDQPSGRRLGLMEKDDLHENNLFSGVPETSKSDGSDLPQAPEPITWDVLYPQGIVDEITRITGEVLGQGLDGVVEAIANSELAELPQTIINEMGNPLEFASNFTDSLVEIFGNETTMGTLFDQVEQTFNTNSDQISDLLSGLGQCSTSDHVDGTLDFESIVVQTPGQELFADHHELQSSAELEPLCDLYRSIGKMFNRPITDWTGINPGAWNDEDAKGDCGSIGLSILGGVGFGIFPGRLFDLFNFGLRLDVGVGIENNFNLGGTGGPFKQTFILGVTTAFDRATSCLAGQYLSQPGTCAPCPTQGYFCTGKDVADLCPLGHYCNGGVSKKRCPRGNCQGRKGWYKVGTTYKTMCKEPIIPGPANREPCENKLCPKGSYYSNDGSCEACPDGYLCEGGGVDLCPEGYYCMGGVNLRCSGDGHGCPAPGFYKDNSAELFILQSVCCGIIRNDELALCTNSDCPSRQCDSGKYWENLWGCVTCPDGYWCPGRNHTAKTDCNKDQFVSQDMNSRDLSCKRCPGGYDCRGGQAYLCQSGYWCGDGMRYKIPQQSLHRGKGFYRAILDGGRREYRSICVDSGSMSPPGNNMLTDECGILCNRDNLKREVVREALGITSYAKCVCAEGFFLDESTRSCQPCHPGHKCAGGNDQPALCAIYRYCHEGKEYPCPLGACPYMGMTRVSSSSFLYSSVCHKYFSVGTTRASVLRRDEVREGENSESRHKCLFVSGLRCPEGNYRHEGKCRPCRAGYICPGGGDFDRQNYFVDNLPYACPVRHWCGDRAWGDYKGKPQDQTWKNQCNECIRTGMFRLQILDDHERVNDFTSVCCEDRRWKIEGVDCDATNCPVICLTGQYAGRDKNCQVCPPGYVCPRGENSKITWCRRGHFCGSVDTTSGAAGDDNRQTACPGWLRDSLECSIRNEGVVNYGTGKYANLCSLAEEYNAMNVHILDAEEAPGLRATCETVTRYQCRENEQRNQNNNCQCIPNFYRLGNTKRDSGCLPCPLGHVCNGGFEKPRLALDNMYAHNSEEHPCTNGACVGRGYYKVQPLGRGEVPYYNSVCCKYSTVKYQERLPIRNAEGNKQAQITWSETCPAYSCRPCQKGFSRKNGICTPCTGPDWLGLYCPGGGYTLYNNMTLYNNVFKDAEVRLCSWGKYCNNGKEEPCPRGECHGLGFYHKGGNEYTRSKWANHQRNSRQEFENSRLSDFKLEPIPRENYHENLVLNLDTDPLHDNSAVALISRLLDGNPTPYMQSTSWLEQAHGADKKEDSVYHSERDSAQTPESDDAPFKSEKDLQHHHAQNSKSSSNEQSQDLRKQLVDVKETTQEYSDKWQHTHPSNVDTTSFEERVKVHLGDNENYDWDVGIRFYFPSKIGDQEIWGGFDVDIDLYKICPNRCFSDNEDNGLEIALHFGVNWPRCHRCTPGTCDKLTTERQNPFRGIYLAGFTLHGPIVKQMGMYSVRRISDLLRTIQDSLLRFADWFSRPGSKMAPNSKVAKSVSRQKSLFNHDIPSEKVGAEGTAGLDQLAEAISFGPGFVLGTYTTDDWYTDESSNPIDMRDGKRICERREDIVFPGFLECNIRKSPIFGLERISNFECQTHDDSKTCEVIRKECPKPTSSELSSSAVLAEPSPYSVEESRYLRGSSGDLRQDPNLDLAPPTDISTGILTVQSLLKNGKIVAPFCLGDCSSGGLPHRRINGTLELLPATDCSGVKAICKAEDPVTLASTAYILVKFVDQGTASLIADVLNDFSFGSFGIANATVTIEATTDPMGLEVVISGAPNLPAITEETPAVGAFFHKLLSGLNFALTGTVLRDSLSVRLDAGIAPMSSNSSFLNFESSNVFLSYELTLASLSHIFTLGISSTLKICVRNCTADPEFIRLTGTLSVDTVMPPEGPPPVRIGGELELVAESESGFWHSAFGVPVLHLRNVKAGISFNVAFYPPVPSTLILGGYACIGRQVHCLARTDKRFVEGGAYVGIDTYVPEQNFFVAFTSGFSLGIALNIAVDMFDESIEICKGGVGNSILPCGGLEAIKNTLQASINLIPRDILETGIAPVDPNIPECSLNSTASTDINLNCYAYVSVSPFADNSIESIGLQIERGISFGGRLNLFNKLEAVAEGKIDVFAGAPSFYLAASIRMNPSENDMVFIGESYNPETGNVTGDANFFIDLRTVPPSVAANIEAAVAIPRLRSYGFVDLEVNSTTVSFEGEISLFGGIINPYARVFWMWDLSRFYMRLERIILAGGLLSLNHVELDIVPRELLLNFTCSATVLFIADLDASFIIEQFEDRRFGLNFGVSAAIAGKTSSVTVDATLDTMNIEDTELSLFEIDIASGFLHLNASVVDGVISGTVDIPDLQTHGSVIVAADDKSLALSGSVSIFGGLLEPYVEMEVYYDLSYIYASIGNIGLGSFLSLNEATLEVDARGEFALNFRASLTCLFFVDIETEFSITERDAEYDIFFIGQMSVLNLPSFIIANATLSPNLADSEVHSLDVSLAADFFTLHGSYSSGMLRGNFDIPLLGCEGKGVFASDRDRAYFRGSLSLFNILDIDATSEWAWDLTYFHISILSLNISLGETRILEIEEASILVDATENLIELSGGVRIPILGSSGALSLRSNSTGAKGSAALTLFHGFIDINGEFEVLWDGSYFRVAFTDTTLGFLHIEEASITYDGNGGTASLIFDASIAGVGFSASAAISRDSIILRTSIGSGFLTLSGGLFFGEAAAKNTIDVTNLFERIKPIPLPRRVPEPELRIGSAGDPCNPRQASMPEGSMSTFVCGERHPCEPLDDTLWLYTCGGEPLPNGGACVLNRHCRSGRCRGKGQEEIPTCQSKLFDNEGVCWQGADCFSGFCDETGKCASERELGEACAANDNCVSGYCGIDKTCQRQGSLGAGCRESEDCITGFCSSVTQTCEHKKPLGDNCNQNKECLSGYCDPILARCSPKVAIGGSCANHDDCLSETCRSNECVPPCGEDCSGFNACPGNNTSMDDLCGSCNGLFACSGDLRGVGDRSCDGNHACQNASSTASVGHDSCHGTQSCASIKGNVGDNSCNGFKACESKEEDVANNECNGHCRCCNFLAGNCEGCEVPIEIFADPEFNDLPRGSYFSFHLDQWETVFRSSLSEPSVIKVDHWRNNTIIWSGSVKVWPDLNYDVAHHTDPPPYGRREPPSDLALFEDEFKHGDWLTPKHHARYPGACGPLACSGERACKEDSSALEDLCGSCVGEEACWGESVPSVVGDRSCQGNLACKDASKKSSVGNDSCHGEQSCNLIQGSIGNNACNGYKACQSRVEDVEDGQCDGHCSCCDFQSGECSGCEVNITNWSHPEFASQPRRSWFRLTQVLEFESMFGDHLSPTVGHEFSVNQWRHGTIIWSGRVVIWGRDTTTSIPAHGAVALESAGDEEPTFEDGDGLTPFHQVVYIRDPNTTKVIEIDGSRCDEGTNIQVMEAANMDWQKWMLHTDNTVESYHCRGWVLSLKGEGCSNGANIILLLADMAGARHSWDFKDGQLESLDCPNMVLSVNEENGNVKLQHMNNYSEWIETSTHISIKDWVKPLSLSLQILPSGEECDEIMTESMCRLAPFLAINAPQGSVWGGSNSTSDGPFGCIYSTAKNEFTFNSDLASTINIRDRAPHMQHVCSLSENSICNGTIPEGYVCIPSASGKAGPCHDGLGNAFDEIWFRDVSDNLECERKCPFNNHFVGFSIGSDMSCVCNYMSGGLPDQVPADANSTSQFNGTGTVPVTNTTQSQCFAYKPLLNEGSEDKEYFIANSVAGKALSILDEACNGGNLTTYDIFNDLQKWIIHNDGIIESFHCPGMVVSSRRTECNSGDSVIIEAKPSVATRDAVIRSQANELAIGSAIESCTNCDYSLALNINPSDGNDAGYGADIWTGTSNHGSENEKLSRDYKNYKAWEQPFECLAITRHDDGGLIDGVKVWKMSDTTKKFSDYFSSASSIQRQVVTFNGPVQRTIADGAVHIDTDPILASEGPQNNLAFNWIYSNNGVRIVQTDVGNFRGTLSPVGSNDDDSHGIGNDLHLWDTSNYFRSDCSILQPDCHGNGCTFQGTDSPGGANQVQKYGNYGFYLSTAASDGSCPKFEILPASCDAATNLQVQTFSAVARQMFNLERLAGNIFRLENVACSGSMVGISNGTCNGTPMHRFSRFTSKDDLQAAVNECASPSKQNDAGCKNVKSERGWPMGYWNVGQVEDMSGLFQHKADFIEDLSRWDTSRVTTMREMFQDASSFNGDVSGFDTSRVRHMMSMFSGATSFNGNVADWDTSRVTTMSSMFRGASSFNGDISRWNTSKVTNMLSMFDGATSFNADVADWDTSNVAVMGGMFRQASSFDCNLSGWDTSKVGHIVNMFDGASSFNGDISGWDVSRVVSWIGMEHMFRNAESFNIDISGWNVSGVVTMRSMFWGATSFNQNLCSWRNDITLSRIVNIFHDSGCNHKGTPTTRNGPFCAVSICGDGSFFASKADLQAAVNACASASKQDDAGCNEVKSKHGWPMGYWNVGRVQDMSRLFHNINDFNENLSGWNTSKVTDMHEMFRQSTLFNGDVSRWDTSRVTSMYATFYDSAFNRDVSGWATSNVENMRALFGHSSFSGDVLRWDTSKVTTMAHLFRHAPSFNGDVSRWDTSNVADMSGLFSYLPSFNGDVSGWDVSRVVNMEIMFEGASSFNQNLCLWRNHFPFGLASNIFSNSGCTHKDTPTASNGPFCASSICGDGSFFTGKADLQVAVNACASPSKRNEAGCNNVKSKHGWPMRYWNIGQVQDMSRLFYNINDFNEDLSGWDTSKVTDIHEMFHQSTLFNGDVSGWATSNVENMRALFAHSSFSGDVSRWDTSKVTTMAHLFDGVSSFSGDVSRWDTSKVADMSDLFRHASSFNVDVSGWDTSRVTNMQSMFEGASAFNQNLCPWRNHFPFGRTSTIFRSSGCTHVDTPTTSNGPFCALAVCAFDFIGCFGDVWHDRDFTVRLDGIGYNHESCFEGCFGKGYEYFGLQWEGECFCGNAYGKHGPKACVDCSLDAANYGEDINCVYKIQTSTVSVEMSNNLVGDSRNSIDLWNQWKFDDDGTIHNVNCEDQNAVVGFDPSNHEVVLQTRDARNPTQAWKAQSIHHIWSHAENGSIKAIGCTNDLVLSYGVTSDGVSGDSEIILQSRSTADNHQYWSLFQVPSVPPGTFFPIIEGEWEDVFGSPVGYGRIFEANQWRDGRIIWTGNVKVWPARMDGSADGVPAHGRRDTMELGAFKEGDQLTPSTSLFTGSDGTNCTLNSDCKSGSCLQIGTNGIRTCGGAPQPDGAQCSGREGGLIECSSARCSGETCMRKLANNEACSPQYHHECESGLCDDSSDVCGSKREIGETCLLDLECASGFCGWSGECAKKRVLGQRCKEDAHCDPDLTCQKIDDLSPIRSCGGVRMMDHEQCDTSNQCISDHCRFGNHHLIASPAYAHNILAEFKESPVLSDPSVIGTPIEIRNTNSGRFVSVVPGGCDGNPELEPKPRDGSPSQLFYLVDDQVFSALCPGKSLRMSRCPGNHPDNAKVTLGTGSSDYFRWTLGARIRCKACPGKIMYSWSRITLTIGYGGWYAWEVLYPSQSPSTQPSEAPSVAVGTCRQYLANEEECAVPSDCRSGNCSNRTVPSVCKAKVINGEICFGDSDCVSGFCKPTDDGSRLCKHKLVDGERCTSNRECSGDLECVSIGGISSIKTCGGSPQVNGKECQSNNECLSNNCATTGEVSTCKLLCEVDSQCDVKKQFCDLDTYTCTKRREVGETCSDSFQCSPLRLCVDDKCREACQDDNNNSCEPSEFCDINARACMPKPTCRTHQDCNLGFCDGGSCTTNSRYGLDDSMFVPHMFLGIDMSIQGPLSIRWVGGIGISYYDSCGNEESGYFLEELQKNGLQSLANLGNSECDIAFQLVAQVETTIGLDFGFFGGILSNVPPMSLLSMNILTSFDFEQQGGHKMARFQFYAGVKIADVIGGLVRAIPIIGDWLGDQIGGFTLEADIKFMYSISEYESDLSFGFGLEGSIRASFRAPDWLQSLINIVGNVGGAMRQIISFVNELVRGNIDLGISIHIQNQQLSSDRTWLKVSGHTLGMRQLEDTGLFNRDVGEGCIIHQQCKTGFCRPGLPFTCQEPGEYGDPCLLGQSSWCREPLECLPPGGVPFGNFDAIYSCGGGRMPDGSVCYANNQCRSRRCVPVIFQCQRRLRHGETCPWGGCENHLYCGPASFRCHHKKPVGHGCLGDYQCANDQKCQTKTWPIRGCGSARLVNGSSCLRGSDCQSNRCSWGKCKAKLSRGRSCLTNRSCQSNNCGCSRRRSFARICVSWKCR